MTNRCLYVFLGVVTGLAAIPLLADDAFLGRSFDQWSEQISSTESQKRLYAAWAVAQFSARGDNSADATQFKTLTRLVGDSDASVRYWGVQGLAAYAQRRTDGDQKQTVALLLPLLDDKAAAPRIAAAEALALLGHTEKALAVIVAAMDDAQDATRIQAASALERLGPAARPAMGTLEKGTSDSSEYVKRISERALVALGGEKPAAQPKAKGKGKAKSKTKSPL